MEGKKLFLPGINYAWHTYGGDFGGIRGWNRPGVAAAPAIYDRELKAMANTGSRIVRWWMFPDLRGDGIQIRNGMVLPGPTLFADLEKALELAEKNDVYLVLCLFSFEAFAPSRQEGRVFIRNLQDLLRDPSLRYSLYANVIAGLARTAQRSPYSHRLFAWDLINEPEWALIGSSPGEDPSYVPLKSVQPISHGFMLEFLKEVAFVLRLHSKAQITVGQVAPRWKNSWKELNLDFYQWHLYDWMEERSLYLHEPADTCKPVVFGEIPMHALRDTPGLPSDDATLQGEQDFFDSTEKTTGTSDSKKSRAPALSANSEKGKQRRFLQMIRTMQRNGWAGAWVWSFQGRVPRGAPLDRIRRTYLELQ
ncbi:MAG: hypothetical protein KDK23_12895 [Leptospiraceae bacterium]|nr:hypothetical protein [Leptospiraceae bacterium]